MEFAGGDFLLYVQCVVKLRNKRPQVQGAIPACGAVASREGEGLPHTLLFARPCL